MPGRGESEHYVDKAAALAKKAINDHFDDSSDEVKAAVVSSVFSIFAQNVAPTYVLETEGY